MTEHASSSILSGLNERQRQAVLHGAGPLLIFAGAGSGKTRVLTHRAAYLVEELGVPPGNILAVTFTNKAADEMKERLRRLLGPRRREMWIGTFHSTCARILRQDGERVGVASDFVVFDDSDQIALMKDCLRDIQLDPEQFPPSRILNEIGRAKNELIAPRDYVNWRGGRPYDEIVARAYTLYQHRLGASTIVPKSKTSWPTCACCTIHPIPSASSASSMCRRAASETPLYNTSSRRPWNATCR